MNEKKLKVRIIATSGDNNYPTICGIHEFDSLEQAIDFAHFGAKGINPEVDEIIVHFNPGLCCTAVDYILEIYDDYRE